MINKQKKNTFTQKYKFEIINSTSVSDNSFFPPLRKVQSCIVLKAIYDLKAGWQEEEGVCGRESSLSDLGRKSQS